ncbi:hypothetical protein E5288_WYG017038 [Bos mutus]|uniref:Zinc finger MYND domain-containing protein 12 n=1 Tax=Bos mutus TaxID=72004 RepID=A0A6B0RJI1_9CETA|nr:hypothetical protein [Bos mutus]
MCGQAQGRDNEVVFPLSVVWFIKELIGAASTRRYKHLIELCYTVAQKYIFEGKHEDAVPAALHSLRFRMNVHGLSSVELVPAYLLLAEASLGLGRVVQAEEYLSQAQWTVLKSTECSYAIHSLLHRNLGLLYMAKENYEEARYHLANDIYFASCAFGTEHIRASGGYFHLANIFNGLKKLDLADTLYTKVSEIWNKYLNDHYQVLSQARIQQIDLLGKRFETDTGLDEAQEAEAIQILTSILNIRESTSNKAPQKTIFVLKILFMLYFLMMNSSKASSPRKAASLKQREKFLWLDSAVCPAALAFVLRTLGHPDSPDGNLLVAPLTSMPLSVGSKGPEMEKRDFVHYKLRNSASRLSCSLTSLTLIPHAEEYALRALHLAKKQKLSVQEQNTIQDLLNLISVEEAQPIT